MIALIWALTVVLVLSALAWWLSTTAQRLDRLHHRVETSRAALEIELTRRASAALELAAGGTLDPAASLVLVDAATAALDAPRTPAALRDVSDADDAARWAAESDLTEAIRWAVPEGVGPDVAPDDPGGAGRRVREAAHRVQLARRFHDDAVVQTRRLRGKRLVRIAHLAGHARLPETADFADGGRDGTGFDGS
ncbi:hypothetical protein ACFFKU_10635 [Kineococcus gynurae]|uniref:LemA protein n=1 Tax=Kineococcus gynurae TaxID=452979 RepID=A0ABV5LUV8_9ACTN